jgi:hypothetical protein
MYVTILFIILSGIAIVAAWRYESRKHTITTKRQNHG